jgi:predicted phage terminase large subunit-like protein
MSTPRRFAVGPGHYLLEAWRGRVEFGELKRKVVELQETWRANAVLVEDAASGQSLIQELGAGTALPVKAVKPDRDKFSRVAAVCPTPRGASRSPARGRMVAS